MLASWSSSSPTYVAACFLYDAGNSLGGVLTGLLGEVRGDFFDSDFFSSGFGEGGAGGAGFLVYVGLGLSSI